MNKTKKTNRKKYVISIALILIFLACFIPNPERPNYNSKFKLNIVSTYGDNEAYHPKVLNFKEAWNGYKYWMSYTPYPQGTDLKENPHIAVSNDLINWETPEGLKNPLDIPQNPIKGKRYNSDSHIVYNSDLDRMECYWRYVDDVTNETVIYRRCSTDGINWYNKETSLICTPRTEHECISPAILYENKMYKMWYVDTNNILKYSESKDGLNWTEGKKINLKYEDKVRTWHLDVIHTKEKYEMIVVAYTNWETRNDMNLYYTSSTDGINWETAKIILKPTKGTNNWDNKGIYRSSFIYENGNYYLYYSGTKQDYHHGIGFMYGEDIFKLQATDTDFTKGEEVNKLLNKINKNKVKE